MAKDFEVSFVETSWYSTTIIRLSNNEYEEAIKNDNLNEVLQELYWDDTSPPEITDTTKPEYFIEEVEKAE
tara:strand:+ start:54368 stop:54580 length:213 start_codon:yes stop_codon:yes gene_type:complete